MNTTKRARTAAALTVGSMIAGGMAMLGVAPPASAEPAQTQTTETRDAQAAATVVKGQTIREDTTWTADGSPYDVTGPIVVPQGVTLTLGPGVEVSSSVGYGGFNSGSVFRVGGALRAAGTEQAPVTMRFNTQNNAVVTGQDPALRTGVVDLDHTILSTKAIAGSYSTSPVLNLASFSLHDSTWRVEGSERLLDVDNVEIVRSALVMTRFYEVRLFTDGQVLYENNRFREVSPQCGDGALTLRGNTLEIDPNPYGDSFGTTVTAAGCDIDARSNYWESEQPDPRRLRGDTYSLGYGTIDASQPLTGPAVRTPTLDPGGYYVQGVWSNDGYGIDYRWMNGSDGGLPMTVTLDAIASNGEVAQSLDVTGQTRALITGLDPATTYFLRLTWTNAKGTRAFTSAGIQPKRAYTDPGPVSDMYVDPIGVGTGTADVTFDPVYEGGNEPRFQGYTISVTDQDGNLLDSTYATTWRYDQTHRFYNLPTERPLNFTVVASNDVGDGEAVTVRQTLPLRPSAPGAVHASPGDRQATVAWFLESEPNDDITITGYRITGGPDGPIKVGPSTNRKTVTGLVNGRSYSFRVAVLTDTTASLPSRPSVPVTPAGPPGQARDVRASVSGRTVTVRWARVGGGNGSPVERQKVTVGGKTVTVGARARTATVSGVKPGTYRASVRAVNGVGAGAAARSNSVQVR